MENLAFHHETAHALGGSLHQALVGVVASGNLEILAERVEMPGTCAVEIATAAEGFSEIWSLVVQDFVERASPGGVRFSINDGGARPDTVMLRLMQAVRVLETDEPGTTA